MTKLIITIEFLTWDEIKRRIKTKRFIKNLDRRYGL